MKTKSILTTTILAAAGFALSDTSAQAQNGFYNQAAGDIVLFAQAFGGSQSLMLNIGTGQGFRDTTSNIFDIKNIGSELQTISNTTSFGGNWYENPDMYWGVAGVRDTGTSTSAAAGPTGDPGRTLYATKSRGNTGANAFVAGTANSTAWSGFLNSDMTTGAGGINTMTLRMESVATTDRLVESNANSQVDNQNPFLGANPGTAFGIFTGGVQNVTTSKFGAGTWGTLAGVAAESTLDLYRVLSTTVSSGQVGGPLRSGSFEGSFVVDSTGDVSFIVNATPVPEPTTMGATLLVGCAAAAMRRRRRVTA